MRNPEEENRSERPKKQMQRRRRRRSNRTAAWVVVIAALAGVGIGILIGVITTERRLEVEKEVQQETEVETVSSVKEAEPTEEPEKPEETKEPEPTPAPEVTEEPEEEFDAEAYMKYLEESAAEKNMQAGTVEFLNVAGEMYSDLFNASYPRHEYDATLFSTGVSGWMRYGDEEYITRDGIDVSQFNGQIDWEKVKADGVEFAFIRLGYRGYGGGDLCVDPWYEYNLAGAKAAGLDVGVYFFAQAISEEEAREEAAFVLENLAGAELQLPVIYDAEPIRTDEARTDEVTGLQFTKNTKAFCEVIEKNGYQAGYYANLKWQVFMLDMNELKDYIVWYAGYASRPQTAYKFTFWQYSDQGKVDGIDADTDRDIQLIPVKDLTEEEIAEARKKIEDEEKAAQEKAEAEERAAREREEAERKAAEEAAKAGENTTEVSAGTDEKAAGNTGEKAAGDPGGNAAEKSGENTAEPAGEKAGDNTAETAGEKAGASGENT